MELNHFSHGHPLVLSEEIYNDFYRCKACRNPIMGVCYCCMECPYILHKWCAELPRELTHHQLHPDHPLILESSKEDSSEEDYLEVDEDSEEEDSVCQSCKTRINGGFIFRCTQCSFNFHADCALLPKELVFKFGDPESLPAPKFDSVGTKMDLTFEKRNHGSPIEWYFCFFCEKVGFGPSFACVSKNDKNIIHSFHIQCAMLPRMVKHERHIHSLTLHAPIKKDFEYDECYCDACEQDRDPKDWVYYCESCEFAAHLGCGITRSDRPKQLTIQTNPVYADPVEECYSERNKMSAKVPLVNIIEEMQKEEERRKERRSGEGKNLGELKHFGHEHLLVLYEEQLNSAVRCHICCTPIFGSTYTCNDCAFYVHKWCAELPREIHCKVLHSEHPLTLMPSHDFSCKYCRIQNVGFSFSCEECDFELHTTCALLPENPIHESHEHPLIPVICTARSDQLEFPEEFKLPIRPFKTPPCNACRILCKGFSLECAQCDFYLHLGCALYPPVGKAKTHMHSLALDYSYEEDPNALEFICDACETPRTPHCWLYRCLGAKCNFVAHVDCAVPKLFHTSSSKLILKHQDKE